MKKAQMTLIIIIGVAFLAIALFTIFFLTHSKEKMTEENQNLQEISSNIQPISNYVESCIETSAKKGIFLLASQGGIIYSSQGGLSMDFSSDKLSLKYSSDGEEFFLPYLIDSPQGTGDCDAVLPNYPLKYNAFYPYGKEGEIKNPTYLSRKFYAQQFCFGKNSVIPLNSMQTDLAEYIKSKIPDCNLSSFKTFDIVTGKPSVSVSTKGQETVIHLTYPMQITEKTTSHHTELKEFRKSIKIGMEEIYNFVYKISELDTNDPEYHIGDGLVDSNLRVSIQKKYDGKDDVITVYSDAWSLDGKNFKFNFARRNRAPALEYIYNSSFYQVSFVEGTVINYFDVIHGPFLAVDPDEDQLNFTVKMGQGTFEQILSKDSPYTINAGDVSNGYLRARVEVTDGSFTDFQEWEIK